MTQTARRRPLFLLYHRLLIILSVFPLAPSAILLRRPFDAEYSHNGKIAPAVPSVPRSCYIHLPFCRRRCFYCDFAITVVGDNPRLAPMDRYVNVLKRELRATAVAYGDAVAAAGGFETLYFGGGTPSLVPPELLGSILETLEEGFGPLGETCEVTLEMDPGTFDATTLAAYMEVAKVNRVSLGVQSWDEEVLRRAGRAHTVAEAEAAVAAVAAAVSSQQDPSKVEEEEENGAAEGEGIRGLRTWSMDLIAGLPFQTEESWRRTLHHTLGGVPPAAPSRRKLGGDGGTGAAGFDESQRTGKLPKPPHLSVYDLQVEQGTAFAKWYSPGESPLPSDAQAADFYRIASETLRHYGHYEHYEISSYALQPSMPVPPQASAAKIQEATQTRTRIPERHQRSPHRSRHNACYWTMKPFLGFGLGASSMAESGARFARPGTMSSYERWVAIAEECGIAVAYALVTDLNDPNGHQIMRGGNGTMPSSSSSSNMDETFVDDTEEAPLDWGAAASLDLRGGLQQEDVADDEAQGNSEAEQLLDGLQEWFMVSLRTSDGFDLDECAYRYGRSAAETIRRALADAERRGLVVFLTPGQRLAMPKLPNGDYTETESSYIDFVDSGSPFRRPQGQFETVGHRQGFTMTRNGEKLLGIVRLTDPEGFLLSNDVISTVFAEMGEPKVVSKCEE